MVGIPDGLGAFRSGHREFTLLMNHEITAGAPGIVRAHGSNGAFVSRWTIDSETLRLQGPGPHAVAGQGVPVGSRQAQYVAGTTQWQRFCSADLPDEGAFFAKGVGTRERIYLGGEEVTEGRAWARVVTGPHAGEAWQLPRLGRLAFENAVASPYPQVKTIVVATDDSELSTAPTRRLPQRGLRVRRHQAATRHPDRAGRPHQWLAPRCDRHRGRPARHRGERRVRARQRHDRLRRARAGSACSISATSPT